MNKYEENRRRIEEGRKGKTNQAKGRRNEEV